MRRRPLSLAGGSLRAKLDIVSKPLCSGALDFAFPNSPNLFLPLQAVSTPGLQKPRPPHANRRRGLWRFAPVTSSGPGSAAVGSRELLGNRDGSELSVNPGPILGPGGRAWVAVASGAVRAERPLGQCRRAVAEASARPALTVPPPGWNRLSPSAWLHSAFAWPRGPSTRPAPGQLGVWPTARQSSLLHF